MARRPPQEWPEVNDAGKRVLAQTLAGDMVEGHIEHAGYLPGEREQTPLFALVCADGEIIDFAELGGWQYV